MYERQSRPSQASEGAGCDDIRLFAEFAIPLAAGQGHFADGSEET
jgi:hypothetical protein